MAGFDIFGLNLPFFIVITILFAYILWSKFLKRNKLGIQNINDILDIFSLSIVLLVFISGSVTLILMFVGLVSFNLKLDLIFQQIPFLIPLIISLLILLLIAHYRKKRPTRKHLKEIVIEAMGMYFVLMWGFIGFELLIYFTALKYILSEVLVLLPLMIVLIIICYKIVNSSLFKIKIKEDILSLSYLKGVLFFVLLTIGLSLFFIPIIDYQDKIPISYHLYDVIYDNGPRYGFAYLEIRVPIEIKTFGFFGSPLSFIPINYGEYDFSTEEVSGANFNILINKSDHNYPQTLISNFENIKNYNELTDKKFGINKLIIDENKKAIALKYDISEIKQHNINKIIFEGYVKKNLSELDYSYVTNARGPICYGEGCILTINVTNNMYTPIKQHRDIIFNLNNKNVLNKSKCKFVGLSTNYPLNKKEGWAMRNYGCDHNSCDFEIYDFDNMVELFNMYIIKDDDKIELHTIEVFKPIKVDVKVKIKC